MTNHSTVNPALPTAEPNIPAMKPKRNAAKIEDPVKQKRLRRICAPLRLAMEKLAGQ
jgi:hypothetical protein